MSGEGDVIEGKERVELCGGAAPDCKKTFFYFAGEKSFYTKGGIRTGLGIGCRLMVPAAVSI